MADISTFNKLLDEYRSNQIQYLSTQRPEYKKAADAAERAVQDALTNKQKTVDKQRKDMAHFASSYEDDTKELFTLADRGKDMRGDAEKLMDNYETSKQRYDAWSASPPPASVVDYANGFGILWRVGVLMLLLPILVLIGFYSPQLHQMSSSWLGGPTATPPGGSPLYSPYYSPSPMTPSNPRPAGWFW